METMYYQLRCFNKKHSEYPGTEIHAYVSNNSEPFICLTNFLDLPGNWIIGFDTKQLSGTLYAWPKGNYGIKLKTKKVPHVKYPLLQSIELVQINN